MCWTIPSISDWIKHQVFFLTPKVVIETTFFKLCPESIYLSFNSTMHCNDSHNILYKYLDKTLALPYDLDALYSLITNKGPMNVTSAPSMPHICVVTSHMPDTCRHMYRPSRHRSSRHRLAHRLMAHSCRKGKTKIHVSPGQFRQNFCKFWTNAAIFISFGN